MTDVTNHNSVVRPDRMSYLTERDRVIERLRRLEGAAASGLFGGSGGGAFQDTLLRTGAGTAVAVTAGVAGWNGLPVGSALTSKPVGAFTINGDGSVTVRDAGIYHVSVSCIVPVAWTTAGARLIIGLGTGATSAAAAENIAREDDLALATSYPAVNPSGTVELAAGAKVWVSYWNQGNGGQVKAEHFSIHRVSSGPEGPQGSPGTPGMAGTNGDDGVVEVYEQPGTPTGDPPDPVGVAPHIGAIWIDTDAPDPTAGGGGPATYAYTRTAALTGVGGVHPQWPSKQMVNGTGPNGDDLAFTLAADGFLMISWRYRANNGPSSFVVGLALDGTQLMEAGNNTGSFFAYATDGYNNASPATLSSSSGMKFGAPFMMPIAAGTHHLSMAVSGTSPGSGQTDQVQIVATFFKFP